MIHAGQSGASGGWNAKQLAAIGITWADASVRGWIARNAGRLVRVEEYERFLSLRRVR
jgi:hypothetical protein